MRRIGGPLRRWTGSKALIFDAIEETTNLVERMHASTARRYTSPLAGSGPLGSPARVVHGIHAATASTVYDAIRLTSRGVESLVDVGVQSVGNYESVIEKLDDQFNETTPLRSDSAGSRAWLLDHAEAHINGFYGDHLVRQRNPLDLGMTLRLDGQVLPLSHAAMEHALPDATGRLCIFLHGLCCTEWSWSIAAEEFHADPTATLGSMLRHELGYTPLYVRYNSGRHISENGLALSKLLTRLIAVYPHEVDEIVLVGHSMGGLIARSAAHYGATNHDVWSEKLTSVFCIAAPTLGSPVEQAAGLLGGLLSAFDRVGTQVPAQLIKMRSAGIKDLRHGYTLDAEWQGKDMDDPLVNHRLRLPLVDGVGYYFIASTVTENPNHPVALLVGDLLVRLPSAAGQAAQPARRVEFHAGRKLKGISHFHLANHPQVYALIRDMLTAGSHD